MQRKPTYRERGQTVRQLREEDVDAIPLDMKMLEADISLKILKGNPVPIFAINNRYTVIHWNKACEFLTGIPANEMVGTQNQWMAFYSSRRPVMADLILNGSSIKEIAKYYGDKFKPSLSIEGGYEAEDFFPNLGTNGKWLSFMAAPLKNDQNKFIGAIETLQDITEQKRIRQTLRESEEKSKKLCEEFRKAEKLFHSFVHSSADAIVLCNIDGKVEYLNPAFSKIFGWSLKEIKGKPIPFITNHEKELNMAIINDLIGTGTPCYGFETRRQPTKDGRLLDVSISYSRYDDDQEKPAGIFAVIRDISEIKLLEEQLQYAQKMEAIGTLASGIAHNFNNILMGIMGNSSMMLLNTDPANPHYEKLKAIEKLVHNGSKLAKQLLCYAREKRYELKLIDLNRVAKETSDTFGTTKKEITINQDLADDLYGINADEGQIEQVLLNLYVNAADAMPKGGKLFIKTMNVTHLDISGKPYKPKPGDYASITIRDIGVGMDKKTMEQIFRPFFTTKELSNGTGLGLSSTYGIIKAHGGYIDVDSKKGQGTTFKIFLPAANGKVTEENKIIHQLKKGTETVLLVDDEEMILDTGSKMLEALGYKILKARDGKEALEIYSLNKDKIDLVILDIIMPVIGGEETYNRMKEINPKIKVLLSSGYSLESQAAEILSRGCNGFMQKPFSINDLSHSITSALNSR